MFSLSTFRLAATTATKKVIAAAASTTTSSVDSSRFSSISYKTNGKTTATPSLFKKSFLGDDGDDDFLNTKNHNKKKRRSPFFAAVDEAEKKQFARLVNRNRAALEDPNAVKVVGSNLKAAVETNAPVNSKHHQHHLNYQHYFKHMSPSQRRKGSTRLLSAKDEAADALVALALKKTANTPRRNRAKSKFYSAAAVRARGGTFSAPAAPAVRKTKTAQTSDNRQKQQKKKTATTSPSLPVAALNPVAISTSFFTSYERKQYNRLKRASLLLRNPRKEKLSAMRSNFYKLWDTVTAGIVETEEDKKKKKK